MDWVDVGTVVKRQQVYLELEQQESENGCIKKVTHLHPNLNLSLSSFCT